MRIRPADEEDLPGVLDVFGRAAAEMFARYRTDQLRNAGADRDARMRLCRHLLSTGVMFVAVDDEVVGFAAAVVRDGVFFLSQLWVVPERQSSGVGSALLDETLSWGRGSRAFSVVSSPHPAAQVLYLRASMYPVWAQHDLTGGEAVPAMPRGAGPLVADDQPWVRELDREVRGIAREEDHRFFLDEGVTGVAIRRDGRPVGYAYVWPGGKVGPGAVRDPRDTPRLLDAARHVAGGAVVSVAVPSTNWTALRHVISSGFALVGTNMFLASVPLADGTRYLSSGGALG